MQHRIFSLGSGLCLGLMVGGAQAALKPEVVANKNVVYDTNLNITLTADANLLGTLEAQAIASTGSDSQLISTIINDSHGYIYDTPNDIDNGYYALSPNDFDFGSSNGGGKTDWWGANAFINYLNAIDYAGSSRWRLPATPDSSSSLGYYRTGSELGGLYYNSLGIGGAYDAHGNSLANYGIYGNGTGGGQADALGPFDNVQSFAYWSGTQALSLTSDFSWYLNTYGGLQQATSKDSEFYVWALCDGNISIPVPEPSEAAMLLSGLALFGARLRRQRGLS